VRRMDDLESERLADIVDVGNHNAEVFRMQAEAIQRAKAAPKQVKNQDGSWPTTECIECDEPIGEGRLELGYDTCIDCARFNERKMR